MPKKNTRIEPIALNWLKNEPNEHMRLSLFDFVSVCSEQFNYQTKMIDLLNEMNNYFTNTYIDFIFSIRNQKSSKKKSHKNECVINISKIPCKIKTFGTLKLKDVSQLSLFIIIIIVYIYRCHYFMCHEYSLHNLLIYLHNKFHYDNSSSSNNNTFLITFSIYLCIHSLCQTMIKSHSILLKKKCICLQLLNYFFFRI